MLTAWLNEDMWTELFIENSDYLAKELDYIIESLVQYKDTIESHNSNELKKLLKEGRLRKELIDGYSQKRGLF